MGAPSVIGEPDVGHNDGVGAEFRRVVDGAVPGIGVAGLGVGVDRHQHLGAELVGIGDALGEFVAAEVEAGEVARVGLVAEAQVDRVGARVDGGPQGRRRPRRTDQL
jgi:hypothetical protein